MRILATALSRFASEIMIKDRLHYIMFLAIRDAKMARPAHATWYVPRVRVPPALQALTHVG